jgi:transcriptional regulator with XRE-family HTH domain
MKLLTDLGTRLKMIRLYGGIKQKDLATQLGIPSPLLSMYEQGKREPSLSFLESFCNRFNMSLSQLFTFHNTVNIASSEQKEIMSDLAKLLSQLEKYKLTNTDATQY